MIERCWLVDHSFQGEYLESRVSCNTWSVNKNYNDHVNIRVTELCMYKKSYLRICKLKWWSLKEQTIVLGEKFWSDYRELEVKLLTGLPLYGRTASWVAGNRWMYLSDELSVLDSFYEVGLSPPMSIFRQMMMLVTMWICVILCYGCKISSSGNSRAPLMDSSPELLMGCMEGAHRRILLWARRFP